MTLTRAFLTKQRSGDSLGTTNSRWVMHLPWRKMLELICVLDVQMRTSDEGLEDGEAQLAVVSRSASGSGALTRLSSGSLDNNQLALPAGARMESGTDFQVAVNFMSSQAIISRRLDRINALEHKLERRKVLSPTSRLLKGDYALHLHVVCWNLQESRAELRSKHRRWAQERRKDRHVEGRQRLQKMREKMEKVEEVRSLLFCICGPLHNGIDGAFAYHLLQDKRSALAAAATRQRQCDESRLTWLFMVNITTFVVATYVAESSPEQTLLQLIATTIHGICRDKADKMNYPWWMRSYFSGAPQLGLLGCYAEKGLQCVIVLVVVFFVRWLLGEAG